MKPKINLLLAVVLSLFFSCNTKTESNWLGPDRNSVFPETGLLTQWPEDGPKLLWRYDSLLMGHSSPAVTEKAIYITGMPDSISGYLFCLNHTGELLWKDRYGDEYKTNYTGSRCTPVIAGKHLYLISGLGELICYNLKTRNKAWARSFQESFNVAPMKYGNAEMVLINGNKLYCTPGGNEQSVVCMDRFTGKTIWKAEGTGETASYSSTTLAEHNGKEIVVAVLERSVQGIDAENGKRLWQVPYEAIYINHANTPVYQNGMIFMGGAAGEGKGGVIAIELKEEGNEASLKWQRTDIPSHLSGLMVHDGVLFTTGGRREPWHCLDVETGETIYTWDSFKYGNISYADGHFYILANNGEVLLCEGSSASFDIVSRFKMDIHIYDPFAPLWAFPVIKNKRLYIRHKGTLFVYDIGA